MPLRVVQSNLNRGELDPLLVGRIDLNAYYNGVQTGKDVLALPQGGLKKRPGQEFINTSLDDGRFENFSFNVEQNYLLVFTALKMEIYKDDVLQTNISGSGNDYLAIPYTLAQIQVLDYIQSADTIIITHPDVETRKITRTSDTAWTIATAGFTNISQYDFNDASSPTPTSEIQRISIDSSGEDGDRFKLSLEGLLTEDIVLSTTATGRGGVEKSIEEELLALPNTGNSGVAVSWISDTPYIYEITFSGESAKNWDEITGTPIFSKNSTFEITGSTVQNGVARAEDSWSATRGWPQTCTFHEGRLYFGGSKSRPQTVWGSRSGDFFNFKNRRSFDDEAIEATLDTDQVNAIEGIFSNRSLQVFTSGGEFYSPQSPITPQNVSFSPQSNLGSKRVRPVTIDGVTLFVQRTGKALIQFVFDNDFKANQSRSVSVLAPHLIKNPSQMAASRGTESSDANYVYIVNDDDGTMTVFNTLASEDVTGFTRWETTAATGVIRSVAVVSNTVYLLVQRVVNSSTVYFIEKENDALNTDSAVTDTTNDADITGLTHLEGETVLAKADGAFMGAFVVASGKITLPRISDDKEAGLAWFPEIETMPLNINLQGGPRSTAKKRIHRVFLQVADSNGIIINGQRIADKTIGVDQFDPPTPQNGLVERRLLGWSREATVTITQDTPMPLTVLNIAMEVKT